MEEEKVTDISSISWKRPDELMKLHLLKKKKKALQARLCSKTPSTSSTTDTERNAFTALENRVNEKRKNPFRTELSKRFRNDRNDAIRSCDLENSSDTTMFQLISDNATSEKKHEQLQTSFTSILSKLRGELDETFESGNEEAGEKYIPLDWSLKSKMRLMSEKPFPWNLQLKTCEEASGITGFVRCVNFGLSPEKDEPSCSLDTSPNARFHQCCLAWQYPSFPWFSVFPRTVGRVSSTSSSLIGNNPELRDCFHREWGESFRSLFQLVRALQCPYFYVCANTFTCLFRASGICGQTDIHAFVTPTTSGFRQMLKNEDVVFSMPLKKSKNSSKRLSGDSVSLNSDGGYDTLDSAGDDQSQSTASQRSFTMAIKKEDEDEEDDDDDDDEPADEWLKSMGMADSEIKRLNSQQDKLISEKVREIDQTPESLIYVEGVEVQALFNFLMNCKSTIATTGPLAGIPPTLLAPVAFRGSSLKPLKVQQNRVKVDTQSYYSIEIRGPILPHTIHNMCSLMKQSQEFSVTFAHVDSTKAFSMAMDLSAPPPEVEEKPSIADAFKSPVKGTVPPSAHTPTKTPTSNALCKENLSDCGLPSSLVATVCCPDASRVRLIDTIRCNADGTYNIS